MSEPSDTQPTVPGHQGVSTEPAFHEATTGRQASDPQAEDVQTIVRHPGPHHDAGTQEQEGSGGAGGVTETNPPEVGSGAESYKATSRWPSPYESPAASESAHHRGERQTQQLPPKRSLATRLASGALLVALSAGAGFAGGLAGGQRAENANPAGSTVTVVQHSDPINAGVDWVAEVANKVQPSVVGIQVRGGAGQTGSGSGVAFTPDGYILTNAHVVDGADEISVRLNQGESIAAELIGSDPLYDIAVIRIPSDIPAAVFNTTAASVGEPVAAFGSPLGLYGTVTVGIVSAVARPVTAGNGQGETSIISAVQTDAAINPGNSGGPLVNAGGEVIGVNSSIATLSGDRGGSIGLGFAIPAKTAVRVGTELINNGTASRPLIGVTVGPADQGGARIETVTPGSPAEQAGIQAGDVLIAVDGRPVENPVAAIALIRDATPGQPLAITLERGGYETTVTVTTTSDAPQVVATASIAPSAPATNTPAPSASSSPPAGAPTATASPSPSVVTP